VRFIPAFPPESVRDLIVLVLVIAFITRIILVYAPLRKLATSIDDDLENRGVMANLNNVSELFLKPSLKQLGRSFIGWEIMTLIAPMAIALPTIAFLNANSVALGTLSRATYSLFAALLVIWLARDIRRSAKLRDFFERSYSQLEGMWLMAENEFQSWNLNQDFKRSWFLNELKQAETNEKESTTESGLVSGVASLLSQNPIALSIAKQIKRGLDYTILAPFSDQIHATVMGIIRTRMNQIVEEQLENFRRKSPLRRANALFEALLPTLLMTLVVVVNNGGL
tara:strand:- start:334 stop:1179 length:846 start_codon:yes stop_codon:yes gene_type:complete